MSQYADTLRYYRTNKFNTRPDGSEMSQWDLARKLRGDSVVVCEKIEKDENDDIESPWLTVPQVVRIADALELSDDSAIQLVAKRMAEQYGLGDDWENFTRVATLVIERYSNDEEEDNCE